MAKKLRLLYTVTKSISTTITMKTTLLHNRKPSSSNHMLLAILFLFSVMQTHAQKVIVNGTESNGKLQWNDFRGKIDKSSSFAAYTFYNLGWKVKGARASGDSMIIEGFEVTVEFNDKNSWVKMERATPQLLLHEQGHFNIGILAVREAMETFKKTKFTQANFKELLPKMVSTISKKYSEMGVVYDKETDHSKNADMQNTWNSFFAERLPELYK